MPERKNPIYSLQEDEPELQLEISDFVVGLAEQIDALQDVHSSGDLDRLGEVCAKLGEQASRLGYPDLTNVANVAADACRRGKPEASEEALVEMTVLTQRIRQAHRGAA